MEKTPTLQDLMKQKRATTTPKPANAEEVARVNDFADEIMATNFGEEKKVIIPEKKHTYQENENDKIMEDLNIFFNDVEEEDEKPKVGKYPATVKDIKITKTKEGKPLLITEYKYTAGSEGFKTVSDFVSLNKKNGEPNKVGVRIFLKKMKTMGIERGDIDFNRLDLLVNKIKDIKILIEITTTKSGDFENVNINILSKK